MDVRPHVGHLFGTEALRDAQRDGWVIRQRHPTLPLSIYNYSRSAQYGRHWDDVTRNCRALVLEDGSDSIVARAFPKFWNVAEHDGQYPECVPFPDESFEVFEKLDGSLILLFWYAERWIVASRGSFDSDQSHWAERWLADKPVEKLDKDVTYVCEAIYPENRIVVDYHGREDLVLLAAFTPLAEITGELDVEYIEEKWKHHFGSIVTRYGTTDYPVDVDALLAEKHTGTDEEGFVIRYASGLRVKAKYAEYVRLHRIYTGLSPRDIWRAMAADDLHMLTARQLASTIHVPEPEAERLLALDGRAYESLLEDVPDEFDKWAQSVWCAIADAYTEIEMRVVCWIQDGWGDKTALWELGTTDRGEYARRLIKEEPDKLVRTCLFLALDRREYQSTIWKAIEPEASKPFANDDSA